MLIQIRSYHPNDLAQIQALNARVKPFRLEDEDEVAAMKQRAQQAQAAGDVRWSPPAPPLLSLEAAQTAYLAWWVAEASFCSAETEIVGMVAVDYACRGPETPIDLTFAQSWLNRSDVAELRYVRVAPAVRGQGIATKLNQIAISWCRQASFQTLVCNTTAAQIPALNLYQKLGFQEVGRSFVGAYGLVWFEFRL